MRIVNIPEENMNEYVADHPYGHYMKTSYWGRFKSSTDNCSYQCVGFYEDNELKGTAMILKYHKHGTNYFYIPWGPCIDYLDRKLTKNVFASLKTFADQNGVDFLRTDPNVVRVPHDIKGNVLNDFNHENVTLDIKSVGFKHKGYGYAYNGSFTNRFTLIVDLAPDEKQIYDHFSSNRKRSIKRQRTWHVETKLGSKEDISSLMDLEMQLVRQDGFEPHFKSYFETLVDLFQDHVRVYVTKVDLDLMIESINLELKGNKYKKDPEARAAAEHQMNQAITLKEKYGSNPVVACGLFVYYGKKSWDLYTYNHKAFGFMNVVDNLHFFAMRDMKALGVEQYDMVGFSGETTPYDPNYGLYAYKSSFGPAYIEYIGEFDYIRNYKKRGNFNWKTSIQSHLRMQYWKIRYKRKDIIQ